MLFVSTQATAQLRIEITDTAGIQDQVPVAVVPFAIEATGVNIDIAKIIEDDLTRSGRFAILPRTSLPSRPSTATQVVFADWRAVDVDYLVVGKVRPAPGNQFLVDVEIIDVVKQRRLFSSTPNAQGEVQYCCSYPATSRLLRRVGHTIANLVYEQAIGVKGVFDTQFAYITSVGPVGNRRYGLDFADIDGQNSLRVLEISRPILSPSWSPDGETLAYVSFELPGRSAIILHNLLRGDREKLISIEGINGAPAWSPDGRRLALSLSHRGSPDIYVVNVSSGQLSQVTSAPSIETEAAWLDNNSIVFTSNRSGKPQIYRKSISRGSQAERLTFEGSYNAGASTSPDGSKIAFVHSDGGNFRIALMDMQDRVLEVLTDGKLDESPSFSPNGREILYSTKERGKDVLGIVSVDGLVAQRIRLPAENVREPAWGPWR